MWCLFQERRAVVTLYKGNETVGHVNFVQEQVDGSVRVNGKVSGLSQGLHGLYVHKKGYVSNGCVAAGDHFNPENVCNLS